MSILLVAVVLGCPSPAPTTSAKSNYLYVANSGSGTISAFTIGSGGALTPISGTFATGAEPEGIAITP